MNSGMMNKTNSPVAPVATKHVTTLSMHGHSRTDKYYWLNDRNNPAVIEYLEAENNYLNTMMAHTALLQSKLYVEMIDRIKPEDASVPYIRNGYYYYIRYEEQKEYPVYCRKKDVSGAQVEILLDGNEMAKNYSYFQIGDFSVSPDNTILAFSTDNVGRRLYTIKFRNLVTGATYSETITNTDGNIEWANDNHTIFYCLKDTVTLRAFEVKKHRLGSDINTDSTIFSESDETFELTLGKTKSGKFITIESGSTLSSEIWFLDCNAPEEKPIVFLPREKEHEYTVDHAGKEFYIVTNWNAKNFRLMKCSEKNTSKENWVEVIPHRMNVMLESFELFNNFVVVKERSDGLNFFRVLSRDDNSSYYIDFREEAYDISFSDNHELASKKLRFLYSSLTTPASIFDFELETKEKTLLKEQTVFGNFDKNNYETNRLYAKSEDNKNIPISIVYRKGISLNGKNPLLLYGYGSYGYTIDPTFSAARLSLLDRGFIFAIAHVRGGQIYGREWYDDGKLLNKKNTFTDFIACAEYLISESYTDKEHLFVMGGSAGGLLMGAVVNMRPDLFKAVVAAVPFVDVVTTMLDESIPLTTGEFDEWGNPKDKIFYDYMLSYSPYDNVSHTNYPAMLVTTGLHDSQVQYWEPAKWVAKLREMKTGNNILLLYTNMDTGHGGASGRFERYREIALQYAFLLDQAGIKN